MKTMLKILLVAVVGIGLAKGDAFALSMTGGAYDAPSFLRPTEQSATDGIKMNFWQTVAEDSALPANGIGKRTGLLYPSQQMPSTDGIAITHTHNETMPPTLAEAKVSGGLYSAGQAVNNPVDPQSQKIFFYLMDPTDAGAFTTLYADELSSTIFSSLPDTSKWFIGVTVRGNEGKLNTLAPITDEGHNTQSGDLFSTVFPIPEPATMILLGAGIAGIASLKPRLRFPGRAPKKKTAASIATIRQTLPASGLHALCQQRSSVREYL